jgi:hypothetical protein
LTQETLNRLLHAIPKLFYTLQTHTQEDITVQKPYGRKTEDKKTKIVRRKYMPGDRVPLHPQHFSVLWLIQVQSETSETCLRVDISKLFLKKHPNKVDSFNGIIACLEGTGLIEMDDQADHTRDNRFDVIKLTRRGERILAKKRRERLLYISEIFNHIQLPQEFSEEIPRYFEEAAGTAWDLFQKAATSDKPNSSTKTGTRGQAIHASCTP